MGTFVRTIVLDLSKKDSCKTKVEEYTITKRSVETIATEELTVKLAGHGYAPYGEWHLHENGTQTFDGFFTNGELRLDSFYVSANYTGGAITVLNANETSSDLAERTTTWSHNKVIFEYHSRARRV
ncbi:hypothetical protein N7490_011165 [Penicillium lividum]|nr:hypothetical protein N7490_011165 [Penicillium lividum]